jgi:hypothetical protein
MLEPRLVVRYWAVHKFHAQELVLCRRDSINISAPGADGWHTPMYMKWYASWISCRSTAAHQHPRTTQHSALTLILDAVLGQHAMAPVRDAAPGLNVAARAHRGLIRVLAVDEVEALRVLAPHRVPHLAVGVPCAACQCGERRGGRGTRRG